MRLLDTTRLEVVLIREDAIPPYAILSHTWGANEASLQDMTSFSECKSQRNSQAFEKIIDAANLAASHGYRWIWIDTCCIDKTSSAELSEAINSMYAWYENASVCYAYIEDLPEDHDGASSCSGDEKQATWTLETTRWVTRGWTLQELIASREVRFYTKDWKLMGEKNDPSISQALMKATGVNKEVLSGQIEVAEVSVANRMKWASKRLTTRPEDMAYCLMGIFGINMPLLYGEGGARAFVRLQEEILKTTDDQSIFAWELPSQEEDQGTCGLLATSPSFFERTRSNFLMPNSLQSGSSVPWSMTNKGLNVQLYIKPEFDIEGDEYLAILDCFQDLWEPHDNMDIDPQAHSPAIHLRRLWGDQYARIRAHLCESVGERSRDGGQHESVFVKQHPKSIQCTVIVNDSSRPLQDMYSWRLREVFPRNMWNQDNGLLRLTPFRADCIQVILRFSVNHFPNVELDDEGLDVAVVLRRTARADLEPVCFPRRVQGSTLEDAFDRLNRLWKTLPREQQDQLSEGFQEWTMLVPEMVKTMRAGRGLYLINLRHQLEIETSPVMEEVEGSSVDAESREKALQESFPGYSRLLKMRHVIQHELDLHLQAPNIWRQADIYRDRILWEEGAKDIANVVTPSVVEICSAIIHGSRAKVDELLKCIKISDIGGPVSTFQGLHAMHLAVFAPDPQIMSALLEKGLEPFVVTDEGLNPFQLASFCGKSEVLATLLRLAPQDEENKTPESSYERQSYDKAVSRFRPYFGSEAHLQDTALHLAAVCCSAEEFDSIFEVILKATRVPVTDWTDSEISLEWEYLACLRNSLGETVLQRAAAVANRDVVRLICERAPQASTRIDSTGRSALWYAAYGGDREIVSLIAEACSRSPGAPILHLSDDNGITPLHVACWRGHSGCVEELFNLGAAPLPMSRELNLTPLHCAALFGKIDCLRIILEKLRLETQQLTKYFALLDMRASKGEVELFAPIHLAAANGWLECVRELRVNGASASTESSFYYLSSSHGEDRGLVAVVPSTPAEMARREGHMAVVRFLEPGTLA